MISELKKLLFRNYIHAVVVLAIVLTSACISTVNYESNEGDGSFTPNNDEYDDETYNLLKIEIVATTLWDEVQLWVVSSEVAEPTVDNFANVRDLLKIAESNGNKVTIELRGITHIPDYALYNGDTEDSSFNFSYNTALVSIFSDDVTHIGSNAFAGEESHSSNTMYINLQSVSFPNATSIGYYTFSRCFYLTDVNLPKLETVPQYAFSDCWGLTEIELPSATTIEAYAFRHCYALQRAQFAQGAEVNSYAFLGVNPTPTIAE
ncbi:MAG: leucine-rich repeat domain-containing protein [Rikenellaceae bacterium]